eukprot:TRINITY_DN11469_c0_g3_i2.p1 TRINITY_DN11469_c0_g3~~TRINITY_DN11469_c0_g3_i2.p1  ORF type:complete len:336 (+),score=61.82 TRINITY_DN11469_c0_g3_i2:266-1273(+)
MSAPGFASSSMASISDQGAPDPFATLVAVASRQASLVETGQDDTLSSNALTLSTSASTSATGNGGFYPYGQPSHVPASDANGLAFQRLIDETGGKRAKKQRRPSRTNKIAKEPSHRPKTVPGQCLPCLGIKQLEARSNRDNTQRFLVCNSCRKSHLSLFINAYETNFGPAVQMLGNTQAARRRAAKATRKQIAAQNRGIDMDNRSWRLLLLHANVDLKGIAATIVCDDHIINMQEIGINTLKSLTVPEQVDGGSQMMEGFKLMDRTYWVRDIAIPDVVRAAFNKKIKKTIADHINDAIQTRLAQYPEFVQALQQPALARVENVVTVDDVHIIYCQ